MSYFVYRITDLEGHTLLYVGRAVDPRARYLEFLRREGVPALLEEPEKFDRFEDACAEELRAIEEDRPLYNKRLVSSAGGLGSRKSEVTKQKIRSAMLGREPSNKGKAGPACSEEKKAKLRDALLGKKRPPFTEEHKLNISKARKNAHAAARNPGVRPAPDRQPQGRVPVGAVPVARRRIKT